VGVGKGISVGCRFGVGVEAGAFPPHPLASKIKVNPMKIPNGFIAAPELEIFHDYRSGVGGAHPSMEGFRNQPSVNYQLQQAIIIP